MDLDAVHDFIEVVKAWIFPFSAAFLCVYPAAVLLWTIMEGRAAARAATALEDQFMAKDAVDTKRRPPPLKERVRRLDLAKGPKKAGFLAAAFAAVAVVVSIFLVSGGALGFVAGLAGAPAVPSPCGGRDMTASPGSGDDEGSGVAAGVDCAREAPVTVSGLAGAAAAGGAAGLCWPIALSGAAAVAIYACSRRLSTKGREKTRKGSYAKVKNVSRSANAGVLRRCSGGEATFTSWEATPSGVAWYPTPPDSDVSMWHNVDLRKRDWLEEPTEEYHYVNEIPKGCLQKFELQTRIEKNVIREDAKGSKRLLNFGRPVPFNYGCFPQTFRDPAETDEIFGAPGDDDPLDVLDLSLAPVRVGEVANCRPVGGVCLIDEGQADWKILVVNTDQPGPLASARTVEDVERLAPGRIDEALKWMDEFKQHSGDGNTTLHFEIYDASVAIGIINKDHAAWKRLVARADSSGLADGHWVRSAGPAPQTLPASWTPPISVLGRKSRVPSLLTGASVSSTALPSYVTGRVLKMRRQTSAASDTSSASHRSSDTDFGVGA